MNPNNYIAKPCHENWNTMSGDEKRKFCEKCSTHVHDLTEKSDDEIRTLHRANGGKLCGSFRLRSSLVIGSGIASLALASCDKDQRAKLPNQSEDISPTPEQTEHLVGKIGPTPPQKSPTEHTPETQQEPAEKPVKKVVLPPEARLLMGVICPPQRERLPEA